MAPPFIVLGKTKLDRLLPIWEEGSYYQTCVRTAKDGHRFAMTKSLALIGEYSRPNALHCHVPNGAEDIAIIERDYGPYAHLIDLVIFDAISRPGCRADIRYHSMEVRRRLVTREARVFDDDYTRFVEYDEARVNGPTPSIDPSRVTDILRGETEKARLNKQLIASISESTEYMGKKELGVKSTIRSGVVLEVWDLINKMKAPNWNMYRRAYELGMITNEDILSSGRLIPDNLLRLNKHFAAIGDRSSNVLIDLIRYECAAIVLCELHTDIAVASMQTKFKRNFNKGKEQNGWMVPAKEAIIKIKQRVGDRTIPFPEHRYEIERLAIQAEPNSVLSKHVLKPRFSQESLKRLVS